MIVALSFEVAQISSTPKKHEATPNLVLVSRPPALIRFHRQGLCARYYARHRRDVPRKRARCARHRHLPIHRFLTLASMRHADESLSLAADKKCLTSRRERWLYNHPPH